MFLWLSSSLLLVFSRKRIWFRRLSVGCQTENICGFFYCSWTELLSSQNYIANKIFGVFKESSSAILKFKTLVIFWFMFVFFCSFVLLSTISFLFVISQMLWIASCVVWSASLGFWNGSFRIPTFSRIIFFFFYLLSLLVFLLLRTSVGSEKGLEIAIIT